MGRSHRDLVYDPIHSTRRFKRFMRVSTSGFRAQEAFQMGEASVMGYEAKHWRTNPYPPGRRHDLYEQGVESARETLAEERAMRKWR